MSAPRVLPRSVADLSPTARSILDRIPGDALKGVNAPVHVLGTLMHGPATLEPFLEWWVGAKADMALSVREQELVILRMGVLYDCEYVWRHHVPVGREFGVTEDELQAVRSGDFASWRSDRERALLALTDALVETRTVGDEAWAEHGAVLSTREVVELIQLVAQYVVFALTNQAFRVALEPAMEKVEGLR